MAIYSNTIDNSKIKFKFSEPYASEAANIQTGVNAPGAYRGAIVRESSTPGTSFVIGIGSEGDSLILHQNTSNGFATVVRMNADVTMDMSSAVTWPLSGDVEWVVYLTVNYTSSTQTTGEFAVDIPASVPSDAVVLARIILSAGATAITDDDIYTDGDYRDKVLAKKGMLVRRLTYIPAVSSLVDRKRIQLLGRISYLNTSSNLNDKVRFVSNSTNTRPLVGGNGGKISGGAWYTAETGGSVIGVSDLDQDGCYNNPWISIDFSQVSETRWTDSFYATYYEYVDFENIDITDGFISEINTHSSDVIGETNTDYTDDLLTGNIPNQMDQLLNMIHNRIRVPHPSTATSTWTLLWRNNNSTSDASVVNETASIYFSSNGMLYVKGGYVSGTTNVIVADTGDVFCVFNHGDRFYKMAKAVGSGDPLPLAINIYFDNEWDSHDRWNIGGGIIGTPNVIREIECEENCLVTMNAVPNSGGRAARIEILRLSESARVYYTRASDTSAFEIATGCYWDDSTNTWKAVGTYVQNACILKTARAGFLVQQKDRTDSDWSSGWTDGSWSGNWGFGTDGFLYPLTIAGDVKEEWIVTFKAVLTDDLIRGMTSSSDWDGINFTTHVDFRGARIPYVDSGDFTFLKKDGVDVNNIAVSEVDAWGFDITGDMYLLDLLEGSEIYSFSTGVINIVGTSKGLVEGAHICIRGDGVNTVWQITDVTEVVGPPAYTSLTVYVAGASGAVPGSVGSKKAYYIPSQNCGAEMLGVYYVRLHW